jgi:hypothetical protein
MPIVVAAERAVRGGVLGMASFQVPRLACQPVVVAAVLPYGVTSYGKKTIIITG